jgi:hypothetical protein
VKFSVRQILASAVGAVLAAVIASFFGVTGTIVGVAIGSCVATIGTALVSQSIERGHVAVKQVAVRAPDTPLLRRLGSTDASGTSATTAPTTTIDSGFAQTEAVPATSGGAASTEDTVAMESPPAGLAETQQLEVSAVADAPATEHLEAVTLPARPQRTARPGLHFTWRTFAATAGIVFLLALLFVTAIELISGNSLSAIFGNHSAGPSVERIFVPSSPGPTTTTTTTTTVPVSTTTTTGGTSSTTTASTTTTSTTVPNSGSTTTTTGVGSTGTPTTTTPGATTTTTAPG